MPTYLAFYGIIFSLLILANKVVKKQAKYILTFVFVIIILFAGLRGLVGSDTGSYLLAYGYVSNIDNAISLSSKYEPGFLALLALHKILFNSEVLYILSMSIFQAFLLYAVIKNRSDKNIFLICYILIFYLNFHFNITRSAISAMLFLYSQCGKSVLMKRISLVLAPFFHLTILPFYLILIFRMRPKYILLLFLFLLIFINLNIDFFAGYIVKYSYYEFTLNESNTRIATSSMLLFFVAATSLIFLKKSTYLFKATTCFFLGSILLSMLIPIGYRYVITSSLFYIYYLIDQLSVSTFKYKNIFLFSTIALLFYGVVSGIAMESNNIQTRMNNGENISEALDSTYIPYKFFWSDLNN